jgi:hypothetical protein
MFLSRGFLMFYNGKGDGPHRRLWDTRGRWNGEAYIVSIDFVATFDSVSHKLLDQALAAAGASDKSRAIFRAIYTDSEEEKYVDEEDAEELGLDRPDLAKEKTQSSRVFDLGVV